MASRVAGRGVVLLVMTACANSTEAPPPQTSFASATPGAAGSSGSSGGDIASGGSASAASEVAGAAGAAVGGSGAGDGSGGATAGSGGTAAGGTSGTGSGAGEDCAACTDPAGVRLNGVTNMTPLGSTGGTSYYDQCSDTEVLVGVVWEFGDHPTYPGNPRVLGLRAVCAPLLLVVAGAGYAIQTGTARELEQRGSVDVSGASAGTALGSAGEVIVALGAKFGDAAMLSTTMVGGVKELSLSSAGLEVESGAQSYAISIGGATALEVIGAGQSGDTTYPVESCPSGQVARGLQIRSGSWIDAVGLICGTPTLVYPAGTPCTSGATCASGSCATTCQP